MNNLYKATNHHQAIFWTLYKLSFSNRIKKKIDLDTGLMNNLYKAPNQFLNIVKTCRPRRLETWGEGK